MLNKVLPEPGLRSIAYGERAGLNSSAVLENKKVGLFEAKNDADWLTNQRFSPGMPT